MTHSVAEVTVAEKDDPELSLRDTNGRLNWSDLLESIWAKFQIEQPGAQSSDARSAGEIRVVESATPTIVEEEDYKPVVELPRRVSLDVSPRVSFYALQEWEGHIIEVSDETFTARLADITAGERHDGEEVQLPIGDLTDDDREILAPGRVFRWSIGYQRSRAGSKKRVSQIVFRRLPQWTEKDLADAKEEARQLSTSIKWE